MQDFEGLERSELQAKSRDETFDSQCNKKVCEKKGEEQKWRWLRFLLCWSLLLKDKKLFRDLSLMRRGFSMWVKEVEKSAQNQVKRSRGENSATLEREIKSKTDASQPSWCWYEWRKRAATSVFKVAVTQMVSTWPLSKFMKTTWMLESNSSCEWIVGPSCPSLLLSL